MENTATRIEMLYESAKQYADTNVELLKLNAVDKTADVLSSIISRLAFFMIVAMFTIFVNISIGLYLGNLLGAYYLGFLIVSCFYLILSILIYIFSDKMIKEPIANLVIAKLLKSTKSETNSKNLIKTEDENL